MLILGFSGRKQSGKSSACNFLKTLYENRNLNKFKAGTRINVQIFNCADPLKHFCIDIMGLSEQQMYGTNSDKNSLTRYKWEDLPHYNLIHQKYIDESYEYAFHYYDGRLRPVLPSGFMSAREILQEVGTGIFRRMYGKIWAEALIRSIKNSSCGVALIGDLRFEDEADSVLNESGRVVRLTRKVFEDNHVSETSLNNYKKFSLTIDNQNLTMEETHKKLLEWVEAAC